MFYCDDDGLHFLMVICSRRRCTPTTHEVDARERGNANRAGQAVAARTCSFDPQHGAYADDANSRAVNASAPRTKGRKRPWCSPGSSAPRLVTTTPPARTANRRAIHASGTATTMAAKVPTKRLATSHHRPLLRYASPCSSASEWLTSECHGERVRLDAHQAELGPLDEQVADQRDVEGESANVQSIRAAGARGHPVPWRGPSNQHQCSRPYMARNAPSRIR